MFLNIRFSDLSYQSQNSKMSYIYKEIYSIVLTFNQQLLVKDEVKGGPLKRPLNTDDEGLKLTYDYTTLFQRISRICVMSSCPFNTKLIYFLLSVSLNIKYE